MYYAKPMKMALFHGKMAKHLCMWKKCCNFAAFYKDRTNILQQQTVRFSRVNPVNLLIREKETTVWRIVGHEPALLLLFLRHLPEPSRALRQGCVQALFVCVWGEGRVER